MIKRILGIAIPLMTCATLFAQDYIMFQTQYLELRDGQHSALQAGVKKHNKKFHDGSNGPKAYLWYVSAGPYSGQYNWAVGPSKFADMDQPLSKAHIIDWEYKVAKYARSHGHTFMMRDEEMTYNPKNETVGENILMKRIPIKNGQEHVEAVENAVQKIADVLKKTNAKIARRVYRDAFPDGHQEIMLVYPFSSWSEFEGNVRGLPEGFQNSYEKIHGKGSFRKEVMDVLSTHSDGVTHEVMTMVK